MVWSKSGERDKMTSEMVERSPPVALDCRTRTVRNPNTNIQEEVPELDPIWMEVVQFIPYNPPPLQFEEQSPVMTDQASLEEWTENVTFINEDLKRLLSLPHSKFWCQVIFDETLQQCLDSYLRFAPRDFDMWSSLPLQVSQPLVAVHQRVFLTYLRMSTHKESKEDFVTPGTFGDILYENFLFDIPKLLDICALFGGEQSKNTPLLRKMMDNIFSKQPKYHDDLNATIPTIYETLDNILVKCGLEKETYAPERLDDHRKRAHLTAKHLQDIVLYLTDTFQTLVAFLHTLPSLCSSFQKQGFVTRIAGFFDSIAPVLEEGSLASELRAVRKMWRGTKVSLLKLCHLVLQTCCIEPLTSSDLSRGHEQLQDCVEEYLEVFTSILSYKRFLSAYNVRFSIHNDLIAIEHSPTTLDETRAAFIMAAVDSACEAFPSQLSGRKIKRNSSKHSNNVASSTSVASSPRQNGPIILNRTVNNEQETGASAKTVDDVELVSMVTHVQDILPDLGEGFLIKCLEELNYDVERVISSILEDNLPTSLQSLSRDLSKEDVMKSRIKEETNSNLIERHSVYDRDEFDVFSHNGLDSSKIQKGKHHDRTNLKSLLADRTDMTEAVKERYSSYDVYGKLGGEQDFQDVYDIYDDEYDDTYDTHNVGAMDDDLADKLDELRFRRPFTTPRVLGGSPEESSEEEDKEESEGNAKNGGQANGQQDKQVQSQDVRNIDRGAGRGRGAKDNNRTDHKPKRDVKGRGRGQGGAPDVLRNRAFKEKHKASRSNHNRKAGADRKRNKGMGALPPQ